MEDIIRSHKEIYGEKPLVIASAPGRVNLIGEHTDYNDGFVLPMAIDFSVMVAVSPRKDQNLKFYSVDFNDKKRTSISNLRYKREDRWANYPKGMINVILSKGYRVGGINLTIKGNVPVSAGLSSSAALEIATGFAIRELFKLDISGLEMAAAARDAEDSFVGVHCGVMDQFISCLAREEHVMLIDTRTLEFRQIPLKLNTAKILITNSNVPRALIDSEYNQRREECEKCVALLNTRKSGSALRDYTAADLRDSLGLIPESTRKRCLHVVEENQRVLDAEIALKRNNFSTLGKLMNRSHESLRDLYEVTCPELDWLVKRAWETEGVYGSRMTGAGFGGCTVSIIEEGSIQLYEEKIEQYERIFSFKPEIYICKPRSGAKIIYSSL